MRRRGIGRAPPSSSSAGLASDVRAYDQGMRFGFTVGQLSLLVFVAFVTGVNAPLVVMFAIRGRWVSSAASLVVVVSMVSILLALGRVRRAAMAAESSPSNP